MDVRQIKESKENTVDKKGLRSSMASISGKMDSPEFSGTKLYSFPKEEKLF